MTYDLTLRDTLEEDLSIFFQYQSDPDAIRMAAFTPKDPTDREAFMERWRKILSNDTMTKKTVLVDGQVIGQVVCFERGGNRELTYWLGREYWGRGLATRALSEFIAVLETRPLYARAAKDNVASIRVLEKCGFVRLEEAMAFSNARGEEVEEVVFVLE